MKKLVYILPALMLALACGAGEPAEDAADSGEETAETVETTEEVTEVVEETTPPSVVTARHILVCYDGCAVSGDFNRTQEEAREQIASIQASLEAGDVTFAQAAVEHSDCPSGQDGGMLGEFGRGAMVPAFEEAAFALPVGGMSDIVETQFGYHLILREQ